MMTAAVLVLPLLLLHISVQLLKLFHHSCMLFLMCPHHFEWSSAVSDRSVQEGLSLLVLRMVKTPLSGHYLKAVRLIMSLMPVFLSETPGRTSE